VQQQANEQVVQQAPGTKTAYFAPPKKGTSIEVPLL
jgi:hypothetical protein